ncbi:MAG: RNA pyrophosphohydrolase [Candidatus Symbiobacter sp.]|nr:RNA pyrophosphohydrolase [Candidatus Symbiobacter sp.]
MVWSHKKPLPDPAVYRPGVGMMVLNQAGSVLVAQRLDSPQNAAWQMPQGGIDAGETPRQAAHRELAEEIGVAPHLVQILAESPDWDYYDLPPDLAQKLWDGNYIGQRQKWFCLRFLGQDSDINLDQPHPEFSAWQWVDRQKLPDLIVPFKRDLYQSLVTRFANL